VSFSLPGFVVLPAGAIKDAEGVGDCSQVFFVSECQDGAGGCRVQSKISQRDTHCLRIFSFFLCVICTTFSLSISLSLSLSHTNTSNPTTSAVELGIADPREDEWRDDVAQRSLLRKGDSFFIPPGNIYRYCNCEMVLINFNLLQITDFTLIVLISLVFLRLENHSSSTSCTLFWAIVRPLNTVTTPDVSNSNPAQGKYKGTYCFRFYGIVDMMIIILLADYQFLLYFFTDFNWIFLSLFLPFSVLDTVRA
jgi:hypothetical protein